MLQKHALGLVLEPGVLHFSPSAKVPLQSQKSPEVELRAKASIPAVGGILFALLVLLPSCECACRAGSVAIISKHEIDSTSPVKA